jgi:UTP-glucose-1-phosphate uridylyltransferase
MLDTAVIPCGGLGTRLQPITRWVPKELLPVGLRPVLYWALDEIADAGVQRAIVITSPLKAAVEAAARTYPGPLELEFVLQQRPRGLGDAFLYARDLLAGAPFAAVLPEFLFRGANPTRSVVELHRRQGAAVALVAGADGQSAPPRSAARPATVRERDRGLMVTDVAVDASPLDPGATRVRLLGRYVFPGDVFTELEAVARCAPAGTEVDGLAVLQGLARRGDLAAVTTLAAWYEVGLPEGYRSAVADFPAQA